MSYEIEPYDNQEILDLLSKYDMHVHRIDDMSDILSDVPLAWRDFMTHFVMLGSDIVHKGSVKTIENFVLAYDKKENSNGS